MKVKMILPALTEAKSPFFRPIKYSLFPPLGLATLAGYLDPDDEVEIQDEHVEELNLNDKPDLVVIEAYITSAFRSYEIAKHYKARGSYVAMGGLHVTSMPDESIRYADSIFLGPGEDTWPVFLKDFKNNLLKQGIETATFHILTPYPGTDLYHRLNRSGRIFHNNWNLYDTRHVVFKPYGMGADALERGYRKAYNDFYNWGSILRSADTKRSLQEKIRHIAYTGGWKKFEGLWGRIIKLKKIHTMRPVLESVLSGFGRFKSEN